MSAPQKLTDDQIRWVRQVMAKRRDLQRQLEMMPTLEEMADELHASSRYLREVVYMRARLEIVEVA